MFLELFEYPRPVIGMLHLKGGNPEAVVERAVLEAELFAACGVDGMIVEDYFGSVDDVERVLAKLSHSRPGCVLGVNVLDNFARTYELAMQYGAKFVQVDSICGHLSPEDETGYFNMVDSYRAKASIAVIGGVRFKYQPFLSGRSLAEDLQIGMQHCDAIAVTGSATGVETGSEKISEFRSLTGNFPLVVAAGMTPQTVHEKLAAADAAIVGSTFKDTREAEGDVFAPHVQEFMDEVRRWFRPVH
jgi:uncharacterized protein